MKGNFASLVILLLIFAFGASGWVLRFADQESTNGDESELCLFFCLQTQYKYLAAKDA